MKTAKSKSFCENFDEALETAEKLYGVNMRFSFTYGDILKIMENENVYPEDVKKSYYNTYGAEEEIRLSVSMIRRMYSHKIIISA